MIGKRRFLKFGRMTAKKEGAGLKFLGSGFKWKRLNLQMSFLGTLKFKILSAIEAVILVSVLAFFYLCCGCNF